MHALYRCPPWRMLTCCTGPETDNCKLPPSASSTGLNDVYWAIFNPPHNAKLPMKYRNDISILELGSPLHAPSIDKNRVLLGMQSRPHWTTQRHVEHREALSRPQTCRLRDAALINCVAGHMLLVNALPCVPWGALIPSPPALWGAFWGCAPPPPHPPSLEPAS